MIEELQPEILETIRRALDEDIKSGDVTTNSIVPVDAKLNGQIVAKQTGVVAGLAIAERVFRELDSEVEFVTRVKDGEQVTSRTILVEVSGPARALLTGERTALNFLGRMSGIASLTRLFVEAVGPMSAQILDTRKTAPGLRLLDKLAVKLGGGTNHRVGLFDMILIKDNHIDFAGSITAAVNLAREAHTNVEIEVETRTLNDVQEALGLGVKRILLDNMDVTTMRRAVELVEGKAKLEASGNVTLETVAGIAATGVDFISVGALTHSAKVFDVSLDWVA